MLYVPKRSIKVYSIEIWVEYLVLIALREFYETVEVYKMCNKSQSY